MPADHGTRSRYSQGCRCDACRKANVDYSVRYRQERPEQMEKQRAASREAMRRLRARRKAEGKGGRDV
jgi:hypothetical protein